MSETTPNALPRAPWQARVLTLYPEMFPGPLGFALAGRALNEGLWSLEAFDIRRFARDRHGSVDDAPFGGGPGMVMRADVVADAIDTLRLPAPAPLVYLSARGRMLTQARARELAAGPGVTLICGRFEGVDQRVIEAREVEEISIGDYVLSGGEIAALALLDACVRLLPGVIGRAESLTEESHEAGLLEYPHYTRPQTFEGRAVPEVLLSGNHERIRLWRRTEAERTTRERRADLWSNYAATRASRA
ncbi:MAG: tRNA (guanosine(37)-N1)-methyltransferase TrmD [Alphaproteobacteria bacterium]|nr:tRNA (guanosine(37)-N1)-methyltransferase TrmD [Alphaproteobacteria bacterium]